MLFRNQIIVALLLILPILSGCYGDDVAYGDVSGTVKLSAGSASDYIVTYSSNSMRVYLTTTIDDKGEYFVFGLLPGKYAIHLAEAPQNYATGQEEPPKPSVKIPKKYMSAKTSGWELEVAEGKNQFNLTIP